MGVAVKTTSAGTLSVKIWFTRQLSSALPAGTYRAILDARVTGSTRPKRRWRLGFRTAKTVGSRDDRVGQGALTTISVSRGVHEKCVAVGAICGRFALGRFVGQA